MIEINWMNGWSGYPEIIVEDELDLLPMESLDFTEVTQGVWLHTQKNGLVRYFSHSGSDRNEGGFGGRIITGRVKGVERVWCGPWSSRASYINTMCEPKIVDIKLRNSAGNSTTTAILLSKLLELWDLPYALIEGIDPPSENGPIVPSLYSYGVVKPDRSSVTDRYTKFIVHRKEDNGPEAAPA